MLVGMFGLGIGRDSAVNSLAPSCVVEGCFIKHFHLTPNRLGSPPDKSYPHLFMNSCNHPHISPPNHQAPWKLSVMCLEGPSWSPERERERDGLEWMR